jgi:hypothetical protein
VLGRERDPVDNGVEREIAEGRPHRGRVADVAAQHVRPRRQRAVQALPAVEDVQLDAAIDGELGAGRADDAAAADEEDPDPAHDHTLVDLF